MPQILTFVVANRAYAVEARWVNSIIDPQEQARLPRSSTLLTGLTNVRGNVVPLFDPRSRLEGVRLEQHSQGGMARQQASKSDGGIIVFEINNGTHLPFIGMCVDVVGRVSLLDESRIQEVPPYLAGQVARFFSGFYLDDGEQWAILKLGQLVSREVLFGLEEQNDG